MQMLVLSPLEGPRINSQQGSQDLWKWLAAAAKAILAASRSGLKK